MREAGGAALRVVVRLASALRVHAGGVACIEIDVADPATVGAVVEAIAAAHPAVGRRLRDEAGTVRRHVNVFVGSENARDLDGVDTVVPSGVEVSVLPAVYGGGVVPRAGTSGDPSGRNRRRQGCLPASRSYVHIPRVMCTQW